MIVGYNKAPVGPALALALALALIALILVTAWMEGDERERERLRGCTIRTIPFDAPIPQTTENLKP